MSPKLLALLCTDAAPCDCGWSGREDGDRLLSSTDLLELTSANNWVDNCGGAVLECSVRCAGLPGAPRQSGGCSAFGVADTLLRCG